MVSHVGKRHYVSDSISVHILICTIIVSVLGVEPALVIPSALFREDLGADSLDIVEMIVVLGQEIDIKIYDEKVSEIATVGQAITYVEQALASLDDADGITEETL